MSAGPEPLALEPSWCRKRQARLQEVLSRLRADRAVVVRPEHVQYLTGFRPHKLTRCAAVLEADGRCLLAAAEPGPESAAAHQVVTFAAKRHSTLRQDQSQAVAEALRGALAGRPVPKRAGVEFSSCGPHIVNAACGDGAVLADVETELIALRRCKDPDELALIERAVACTEAMYARARQIIEPGITELEVFNQLHAAAVEVAGEPLTDLGNDYRANDRGGAPRPRPAQAGELFILDLGPAYRGYYADNCRTFAVNRQPTDEQHTAWRHITAVLEMVAHTVRPGVSARELFARAQEMLDRYRPGAFPHHLGHGIGLYPHEGPHLNPHWDDAFSEGDVFTAEPGLYGPELRAGIRLEENYVATAEAVRRLTQFPLEL